MAEMDETVFKPPKPDEAFRPDTITRDSLADAMRTGFSGPIKEGDEWRPLAQYVLDLITLNREAIARGYPSADAVNERVRKIRAAVERYRNEVDYLDSAETTGAIDALNEILALPELQTTPPVHTNPNFASDRVTVGDWIDWRGRWYQRLWVWFNRKVLRRKGYGMWRITGVTSTTLTIEVEASD